MSASVSSHAVPSHEDKGPAPSGTEIGNLLSEKFFTAEFWANNWEKKPIHYAAAVHGKSANRLPEALCVDDVLALIKASGSGLKMFRKGEPYDMDNFLIGYLDGASLIVNQADRCNQTLFDVCKVLAAKHFFHVFGVVYLTPPGSQGVRLHNDDQDVFLLQVWGSKKWSIRPAPKLLPYSEEMLGKDSPVAPELIKDEIMNFTMEPHDILYIPRGHLHEAHTSENEFSMHVTITVPTSDFCWGVQSVKHLMHSIQNQKLPPQLQALCGESLTTRGAVGSAAMKDAELDKQIQEIVKAWASDLSADSMLDAFEGRMAKTNEGQDRQFQQNIETIKKRTGITEVGRVRLMYGISCKCEDGSETAIFSRASDRKHLELSIKKSASCLIRALTWKPQKVGNLPCEDVFERICVLQILLQHGVLQLINEPSRESSIPEQ